MESATNNNITGYTVSITTTFGETIKGEIFTFDSVTNCVTLSFPAEPTKRTYRIINTNFIENIQLVSLPTQPVDVSVPEINLDKIRAIEHKNLKNAEKEIEKIGVGVSKEAQEIFNALSRTYPCAWEGKNIIVMGEVRIEPPYTAASCSGNQKSSLQRVKRVIEGERAKLKSNGVI